MESQRLAAAERPAAQAQGEEERAEQVEETPGVRAEVRAAQEVEAEEQAEQQAEAEAEVAQEVAVKVRHRPTVQAHRPEAGIGAARR